MITDWEELTFELGPWKETGTFILKVSMGCKGDTGGVNGL